jgi:uncharacterized protein
MLRRNMCVALFLTVATSVGASGLPDAARRGDKDAVKLLLAQKVDVNEPQGDGTTALHWAAYNDDVEMTEFLIRAGASVHVVTRDGALTPLMLAATNGGAAVIRSLLAASADPRVRATDGATALMAAAASGSAEAVKLLLDHGAEVDARDTAQGQTALMFAAATNRELVVRLLLNRGANAGLTSNLVSVPQPVRSGNPGVAPAPKAGDRVAEARARRRVAPKALGGWAALHFAAREGNIDAARALLEGGASVDQVNQSDKSTPLVTAIVNAHYDLAKFLLDKGADPNLANDDGLAPLYATIDMQFAPMVWQPNPSTEQEHVTYLQLMKILLERGAKPNALLKNKLWFRPSDHDDAWTGTAGTTAFWRAAFATDVDAMRLLVAGGADPNIPSSEHVTPLMAAAGLGWVGNLHRTVPDSWLAAVKLCLELGADLNATDIFNYTALHGAAFRGDNALVKLLVEKGARLDVKTIFGTNVTDMANGFVAYGSLPQVHPETVQLLINLGGPQLTPGDRAYCTASQLNCPQVSELR